MKFVWHDCVTHRSASDFIPDAEVLMGKWRLCDVPFIARLFYSNVHIDMSRWRNIRCAWLVDDCVTFTCVTVVHNQLSRATIQNPVTGNLEHAKYRVSKRCVLAFVAIFSPLPFSLMLHELKKKLSQTFLKRMESNVHLSRYSCFLALRRIGSFQRSTTDLKTSRILAPEKYTPLDYSLFH